MIMICGHARHGKDTVADILKDNFGLRHESSSHIAMRSFLRKGLLVNYGLAYKTAEECYEDRVNHRDKWFHLIANYNAIDPAKLSRLIFETNDIYVGIRSIVEFKAAKRENLFGLSVWVDASGRLAPEPSSSNTITQDDCDFSILNNGSLDELREKVVRIFSQIFV